MIRADILLSDLKSLLCDNNCSIEFRSFPKFFKILIETLPFTASVCSKNRLRE